MKACDFLDGLNEAASTTVSPLVPRPAIELSFDEARASAFAKGVAGDFNPLHDVGNKRFCVPGDLLFAALLERYGLHTDISVSFAGMLGAGSRLQLPGGAVEPGGSLQLLDQRGREVVGLSVAGDRIDDVDFMRRLTEEYVSFSGRTFPGILMPLMCEAGVMINPARPLIIYKDMGIRLDGAAVRASLAEAPAGSVGHGGGALTLEPAEHEFSAIGKKGAASVRFRIVRAGSTLGEGEKNFVLTGLRDYDAQLVDQLVSDHAARVATYASSAGAHGESGP